jgi:hypothetical protein
MAALLLLLVLAFIHINICSITAKRPSAVPHCSPFTQAKMAAH